MARDYSETSITRTHDRYYIGSFEANEYAEPLTLEELESMDLERMTPAQLDKIASRLLLTDRKQRKAEFGQNEFDDGMLTTWQWKRRRSTDVAVADLAGTAADIHSESNIERPGVIKNHGQEPMFNRSHPQGRKVRTKAQRDGNGSAYYR